MKKPRYRKSVQTAGRWLLLALSILLAGCGGGGQTAGTGETPGTASGEQTASYHQISQEEAKEMMTMDGTQIDARQLTFNCLADANGVTMHEYTAFTA